MSKPDLYARDYILAVCGEMRIEDHQLFERELVMAAWPPTGEADDTPAMGGITSLGELRTLASAIAGNRPVGGYTSIECLRANLGKDFRVDIFPLDGRIHVHRVRNRNDPVARSAGPESGGIPVKSAPATKGLQAVRREKNGLR